jgi:hypothetical protein
VQEPAIYRARAIFDNPKPPPKVWERQFDYHDDKLRRMARTSWDKIEEDDLWYYLHDLAYQDLQPDLFAYLFPVCLNFWQTSLIQNRSCSVGDAEFHYALLQGQILQTMVTPREREDILDFLHDGFLDRLSMERGFIYKGMGTPAYGWMHRFNSLGLVTPLTGRLWGAWWKLDTPAKAVCGLMYLSGLMYSESENPVFRPWSKEGGGGGPYLWEDDSYIYNKGWLPENLEFLRKTLTVDYFSRRAQDARAILTDQPEANIADTICADFPLRRPLVQEHIGMLIDLLGGQDCAVDCW